MPSRARHAPLLQIDAALSEIVNLSGGGTRIGLVPRLPKLQIRTKLVVDGSVLVFKPHEQIMFALN